MPAAQQLLQNFPADLAGSSDVRDFHGDPPAYENENPNIVSD
jgi:hypothetical protein